MSHQRTQRSIIVPPTVQSNEPVAPQLTPGLIQSYMRARGVHEEILVHTQNYRDFLKEKGVTELGRGGEGAVYFLRGHVVKLVGVEFTPSLLREIVHMLHLNPSIGLGGGTSGTAMGDRERADLPGLLWVYTLSNGGLSVGMKPFDRSEYFPRGSTLYDRLAIGPALERDHALRTILSICKTLVYIEKKGIVHHDLKPANIYIPGDPHQEPVVFDLGQALWRQNVWGINWLAHGHNLHYWYNGTYQYMHKLRRQAHLCALNIAAGQQPSPGQRAAFSKYVPDAYDDVFSFAYIVRDIARSKFTYMREIDKRLLTDYYRLLMQLNRAKKDTRLDEKKGSILSRVTTRLFGKEELKIPQPKPVVERIENMEQARAKLEPMVNRLLEIK